MSEQERKARRQRLKWAIRFWGPVWVRDIVLFVVVLFMVLSLTGQSSQIGQQREGRKVAIEVLCGAQQGVIDGGRAALLGTLAGPPPSEAERQLRELAAERYSVIVAHAIEAQAHVAGLLDPHTGTLHCDVLVRSARAQP